MGFDTLLPRVHGVAATTITSDRAKASCGSPGVVSETCAAHWYRNATTYVAVFRARSFACPQSALQGSCTNQSALPVPRADYDMAKLVRWPHSFVSKLSRHERAQLLGRRRVYVSTVSNTSDGGASSLICLSPTRCIDSRRTIGALPPDEIHVPAVLRSKIVARPSRSATLTSRSAVKAPLAISCSRRY